MNSIKMNLPKSSYGKQEQKKKIRDRSGSFDSLDNLKRERALSACGVRNENRGNFSVNLALSPRYKDQNSYKNIQQAPNIPKPSLNLPPKPQKKTVEDSSGREQGARLRRVGM